MFPAKIGDRVTDLNTKIAYLKTNASRLGISSADINAADTAVIALNSAQALVNNKDTRTKLDTARRDVALETATESVRKVIYNYVVFNPNATPVDFEALNVPPPGPYPLLPVPHHVPGIGHITSFDRIVTIPFYDALGDDKKGKPEGAQAIEVYMKIGGEPPTNPSEMTERKVSTASPIEIEFDPDMEGVNLYLIFRWVGTRGDYGQWSDVYKVIITK